MKIRYKGETCVSLTENKVYLLISEESGLYRIIDDTGEDYLFDPDMFEMVEK